MSGERTSPTAEPVRRLVLMRHAKAEQAAETDHVRRLTDRGRSDARATGAWIARSGHRPQVIIASSAARAEETAELVATIAGVRRVEMLDELYGVDAFAVIDVITETIGDDVAVAMIVGHDPAMSELAECLQAEGADEVRFPPAGVAVLDCGADPWSELDTGHARLLASYHPPD